MSEGRLWILLGGTLGFLGVALGAFGAHGLEGKLSARGIEVYHTAAQYQMYHALALLALGAWGHSSSWTSFTGWAWTAGTLVFSGSLYALALTDIRWLGAITPIGGLAFLAGWISVAIAAWKA
jgi:uncharacterized membrane protein YgdD (TMEM256/DUF423 family)